MKIRCMRTTEPHCFTPGKIYELKDTNNGSVENDNGFLYGDIKNELGKDLLEKWNNWYSNWGTFEEVKRETGMDKTYTKEMLFNLGIDRIIFNDRATIVFLNDGTKGVSVCSKDDHNDPLVGLSVAYTVAKATQGNKSQFKKNCDKLYEHNKQ